jgi:LemA protein
LLEDVMVGSNSRLVAISALVVMSGAVGACGYNTIPTQQERALAAWAEVQSQYQRRADLIPNLVATVQGAAAQERGTLTAVVEARARATSINVTPETLNDPAAFQQYQAAQGELSQALSRLLMVVENYPTLQANQNFLALQSQLEGTENRITVARRDYNEQVRIYNTSLRTFPTLIWANTLHSSAEPMPLFTAAAEAQTAPQVNFNVAPGAAAPGTAPRSAPPAAAPAAAPAAQ